MSKNKPPAGKLSSTRASAAGRARSAEILRVAAKIFLKHGYAGASIDAIIAEAGGSKRDVYTEFGSKEKLFAAIVRDNLNAVLGALAPGADVSKSLHEVLLEFGIGLAQRLSTPTGLNLYRIIVSEGTRFPALAKLFYDSGPGLVAGRLAEVLEQRRRAHEIEVEDCQAAADQFVGMIRGNLHLAVVLRIRPAPRPEELQAFVAKAVATFLHGIVAPQRA
ncbi:TetR/AcrR family transcriptional regulator [Peristeroidobacter agariperforans]|uniref:TetR/AcrR family transcriptional regulator n=1 Tax=Peristeroidobacter agariperforans TaxID=268404 RepID=UPI00101CBF9E|nr:TetR/AcrR family transcriptional regulator [Peristeroidobacter agariperforans]